MSHIIKQQIEDMVYFSGTVFYLTVMWKCLMKKCGMHITVKVKNLDIGFPEAYGKSH